MCVFPDYFTIIYRYKRVDTNSLDSIRDAANDLSHKKI